MKRKSKTIAPKKGTAATIGICIGLATLVFIAFGQTMGFDFINYDDPAYVYENPIILKGLTLANAGWAFTHSLVGHWHPLTTMAFMLDTQVFGVWAGGHHLANVILHAACAVFLFMMLMEMTGALWRSAFVAAVFAIHPLRAESVAWVSELKDVLSGVFFMLTLWAYARYVKSKGSYWMVAVWFALGLMSKPMLVTIPCVLLLLDYWPLGRLRESSDFPKLLWEKMPLFVLSVFSSIATVFAVKSGDEPTESYLSNTPIAYVVYLWKLIYPSHLALPYILPKEGSPGREVGGCLVLLAALTAGAWLLRRNQPYVLTGWLWYVGMTLPVAGVLQTGYQAYADRYTYLPQIGLCFAGTWMAADWAAQRRDRRILEWVSAAILCGLTIGCWRQVTYWRDSEMLWTHTIESTEDNFVAYNSLGEELLRQGKINEAIAECRKALAIYPNYAVAHNNIGAAMLRQGRAAEAMAECSKALSTYPKYPEAHYNLACALFQQGRMAEGIAECQAALRLDPDYADAHNNLGNALFQQGQFQEAIDEYHAALADKPDSSEAHNNLGNALFHQGRMEEGIAECRAGLRLDPGNAQIENSLAWMLATAPQTALRDGAEAVQLATRANQSTGGGNPVVLRTVAAAYAQTGDFSSALAAARNALQVAGGQSKAALVDSLGEDIKRYEAGRPLAGTVSDGGKP